MNNIKGVTIGDINGIGILLLIDLWKRKKIKNFILITNIVILKKFFKKNNIKIKINIFDNNNKINNRLFNVYNINAKSNNDNTYKSLKIAYELAKNKTVIGIVTLPLNKYLIRKNIDKRFIGQTEFFQKLDNKKVSNMIFFDKKIIITTLTNHIELKSVSKIFKKSSKILNKIISLNKTLINDFGINNPKIIISGLNPHAGENSSIGNEEEKYIKPIVKKLKSINLNIFGPQSADSILLNNNIKKFNCFIFNYHDQALIPFKIITNYRGVNYTGGLNIIRVSPVHGTAYDLVGKRIKKNTNLINCFNFIDKINKNRLKIVST